MGLSSYHQEPRGIELLCLGVGHLMDRMQKVAKSSADTYRYRYLVLLVAYYGSTSTLFEVQSKLLLTESTVTETKACISSYT